ncbi:NepR family anti-sigma factor [Jannaschia seohaensis]|uniref:Anti-sigma factor NepR domain-containing protein n=1 Tax=Jannaschia seohaensis TaxID=475081 RepID=A0A2Y9A1S2_9RHOB|nr:NepR family anti-sigma factor [Jannaschia seohaensis]PWJ22056.1 hypothetical protein BCF38_101465 [Jannaschia seohaensis]SSA38334.1 hypothetical protein SAMN05421539_101465 [Jannaschia seohaensis]
MDEKELDARAAREIDENLRRVFKQMEDSNLPDRFTDLLRQLRESDSVQHAASKEERS